MIKFFYYLCITTILTLLIAIQPVRAELTQQEQAIQLFNSGQQNAGLTLLSSIYRKEKTYNTGYIYGYYLSLAGRHDDALTVFTGLIRRTPSRFDADVEIANIYEKRNDVTQAIVVMNAALKRGGNKNINVISKCTSLYFKTDDLESALELLKSYRPSRSDSVQYLGLWGSVNLNMKNYEEAKKAYIELATLRPDLVDFQYTLAGIHRQIGEYSEAAEIYAERKKKFPKEARIWLENGILMSLLKNFDQALAELEQAKVLYLQQENTTKASVAETLYEETLVQKGAQQFTFGNINEAFSIFESLYNKTTTQKNTLNYAYYASVINRSDLSEKAIQQFIEQNQDNNILEAQLMIAEILLNESRADEAAAYLPKNLEEKQNTDPRVSILWLKILISQSKLNEVEQMLNRLRASENGLPDNMLPYEAVLYSERKEYDQALQVWKTIAEKNPDASFPLIEIISTLVKLERDKEAESISRDTMNKYGDDPAVLLHRMQFLIGRGLRSEATLISEKGIQLLEKENGNFWDNIARLTLLSKFHLTLGNIDDAEQALRKILDVNPNHFATLTQLAYLLIEKKDLPHAEDCLNKMIELQPKNLSVTSALHDEIIGRKGSQAYAEGDLTAAASFFTQLYNKTPSQKNTLNYAYYVSVINRSDLSEKAIKDLLNKTPNVANTNAQLMLAEILLSEGRAYEALDYLPTTIGAGHIYEERTSILLMKTLYLQGRFSDMQDTLEEIKKTEGHLPKVIVPYEGFLQKELGNHEQALEIWRELARSSVEMASPQLEVIAILVQLKRNYEAEALYQEVLLNYPDDPSVWLSRTRYLLAKSRKAEAKISGQKTKELLKKKPETFWANIDRLNLLAQLHSTLGEMEEAERILQEILQLLPNHFGTHIQLAYLYLAIGEVHRAETFFLKTKTFQPKNPTIDATLAALYMMSQKPGKALYWEKKAIPASKHVHNGVEKMRSGSLGVFGYRTVSNLGTKMGFSRFTARPNAMMLSRESLFSDKPLAGFNIDQQIFNSSVGLFASKAPSLWLGYSKIENSNSIETILHLIESNVKGALLLPNGTLTINPNVQLLFERFKSATEFSSYMVGSFNTNWNSSSTNWSFGNQTLYGSERVDQFQVPGTFFMTTVGSYWKKGEASFAEEITYRADKTATGLEFISVITGTSVQRRLHRNLLGSTYVKTEAMLGDVSSPIFGIEPIFTLKSNVFTPQLVSHLSFNPSFSFGGERSISAQKYDVGVTYQNSVRLPTQAGGDWYSYKIPFQLTIAIQQYTYPNVSIEDTRKLFIGFQVI